MNPLFSVHRPEHQWYQWYWFISDGGLCHEKYYIYCAWPSVIINDHQKLSKVTLSSQYSALLL